MYSLNARDHFNCSPSFSHDQHHETDAAKWKGGVQYTKMTQTINTVYIQFLPVTVITTKSAPK